MGCSPQGHKESVTTEQLDKSNTRVAESLLHIQAKKAVPCPSKAPGSGGVVGGEGSAVQRGQGVAGTSLSDPERQRPLRLHVFRSPDSRSRGGLHSPPLGTK